MCKQNSGGIGKDKFNLHYDFTEEEAKLNTDKKRSVGKRVAKLDFFQQYKLATYYRRK